MARVLERRQSGSPVRQGTWVAKPGYRKAEESVSDIDLWAALSNPCALRSSVARDFASAIATKPGIGEVWLTDVEKDLSMALALKDPEIEIEIRTVFLDLVCERLDPSEGDLFVFPNGEVPDWVTRGERLV